MIMTMTTVADPVQVQRADDSRDRGATQWPYSLLQVVRDAGLGRGCARVGRRGGSRWSLSGRYFDGGLWSWLPEDGD